MAEVRKWDRDQFQAWMDHPLNQPYLQWLRDQRSHLMEKWASGQEMDSRHQTKALLLGELSALEWADYAAFYGIPVEEEPE